MMIFTTECRMFSSPWKRKKINAKNEPENEKRIENERLKKKWMKNLRQNAIKNKEKFSLVKKNWEFPKKRSGNIFGLEKIGSPRKTSKLCQNPGNCEILNYYLIWIKRSFLKFKSLTDVGYEVEHHEVGIQDSCSSRRGRGTSINFKPMYILKTDLKKWICRNREYGTRKS